MGLTTPSPFNQKYCIDYVVKKCHLSLYFYKINKEDQHPSKTNASPY